MYLLICYCRAPTSTRPILLKRFENIISFRRHAFFGIFERTFALFLETVSCFPEERFFTYARVSDRVSYNMPRVLLFIRA